MPSGEGILGQETGAVPNRLDTDAQIRAVITRYFFALDRRDYGALATCFAPDATGWYDREYGPGRDAIVAYLRGAMARWDATTHLGGNVEIIIGVGDARAHVSAVAYLVSDRPGDAGARICVRGLRYSDTFTTHADRWVISRRERVADWSFDVDGQHLTGVDGGPSPAAPP
jgi:ketosteroid isomerase-like protein